MSKRVYVLIECEADLHKTPSQDEADALVVAKLNDAIRAISTALGGSYWFGLGLDVGGIQVNHVDAVPLKEIRDIKLIDDREFHRSLKRASAEVKSWPAWKRGCLGPHFSDRKKGDNSE